MHELKIKLHLLLQCIVFFFSFQELAARNNSSAIIKEKFERLLSTLVYNDERNMGIELTDRVFFNSIQSIGAPSLLSTMMSKIEQRPCLSIITIGGSICHGANTEKGPNTAFPAFLVQFLNEMFPCNHPVGHSQSNHCIPGNASSTFVDMLLRTLNAYRTSQQAVGGNALAESSTTLDKSALNADLILVDTAYNDALDGSTNFKADITRVSVQKSMELLLNLIHRLPKFPSVIYVAPGIHVNSQVKWLDRLAPAGEIDAQVEVAKHYQVPYISVLTALGPFDTTAKWDYISTKYITSSHILWSQGICIHVG